MSALGDVAGQVWFMAGVYIFVATAIAVAVLPFYIINNYEDDRGGLDKGLITRLEWLQFLSWLYCGGAVVGTVSTFVAKFVLEAQSALWFWSGLIYLVFAGLTTTYIFEISKQTTAYVSGKDSKTGDEKQAIKNSFASGYVAAALLLVTVLILGGWI